MVAALAYDRANRNLRPVFALTQTLTEDGGVWRSERVWTGGVGERVATEALVWRSGLVSTQGEVVSIAERNEAIIEAAVARTRLASHRTGGVDREKILKLSHPAVTPASLPLFMAENWKRLQRGDRLRASYLILKLPWATTVAIQKRATAAPGLTVIAVTPSNPLLRVLFGAATYTFDADAPRLHRIDGVLDPRDLKARGGWREYLGSIVFDAPLDMTALARAVPDGS